MSDLDETDIIWICVAVPIAVIFIVTILVFLCRPKLCFKYTKVGRITPEARGLVDGVCVIIFNSEAETRHLPKLLDIFASDEQTADLDVSLQHIRKAADIKSVKPVKLYIVIVIYNERQIILEDPTMAPGSLKLATVQGLNRLGGKVILIYSGDLSSKAIGEYDNYNEALRSVDVRPESREIAANNRMFSFFHEFSPHQKSSIIKLVKELAH